MAGMEQGSIIFRDEKPGRRQRRKLKALQTCKIFRHSVVFMLDNLNLYDIFVCREPTFERLTCEFLSSRIYLVSPHTSNTVDTVNFRMFNCEYEYTIDALADLLGFPFEEGAICEAPLETNWKLKSFQSWRDLTGHTISSFEGNLASIIQNPTIRVFRHLLDDTVFSRENSNKLNFKEFIFLKVALYQRRLNLVPFIIVHECRREERRHCVIWGVDYLHCTCSWARH